MAIITSTLRPGLLVSLNTSLKGNVNYNTNEIEADHYEDDGSKRAKWETERVVADPVEHERSIKVRSKVRNIISAVCAHSKFGLLCPEVNVDKLEEAIKAARALTDEFNATARLTNVNVYIMTGRIAPDDTEALRAIKSEVRGLIDSMAAGIKELDVKKIRDAAIAARSVGNMLTPQAQERVKVAIDAARKTAREIVRAGETAAKEIDKGTIKKLKEARTAFLDMEDMAEVQTPKAKGRGIDLVDTVEPVRKKLTRRAAQLDLGV